jgi:hypothetical protein
MRSILSWSITLLTMVGIISAAEQAVIITDLGHTPGGKVTFTLKSDTNSYHVLRRSRDLLSVGTGRAVAVVRGAENTVSITDSVRPLEQGYYRVETYSTSTSADTDGDGWLDTIELGRLGYYNPVNPAPPVSRVHGATMITSRAHFEQLAARDDRPGAQSVREVKFLVYDVDTDNPVLYFADSTRYPYHFWFTRDAVGRYSSNSAFNNDTYFNNTRRKNLAGSLVSHDSYIDDQGRPGMYTVEFWPTDPVAFRFVEKGYELIAASLPFVDGNVAYHPASETQRRWHRTERAAFTNSHVNVIQTEELFGNVVYTGLNFAETYGRLRLVTGSETLSVRDIAIFRNIPNDLTHVAGIMTEIPQTPLSHINLKAKQNNTPNAYIRDASTHPEIAPFLGQNVYYKVDADGFEIRAATQQEVDDWFEAIRPTDPQVPVRNLAIQNIRRLSQIQFWDSDAFGAKAANVAELRRILPGNAPDGFAVPFYFYDEFMKFNGFYARAQAMMSEADFQNIPETREDRLKDFRDVIKDGILPQWMADALDNMHQSFPAGTTPRARSSTNNEDLEDFNGAGLYSSYTHNVDEGHFKKSAKQVWASLWNYRAYEEREFWRIDHFVAAMGILVHPNYADERANGVGVTTNIFDPRWAGHYINVQVGENLVTNPDADSIPEEYLIARLAGTTDEIQYIHFSNQVPEGETVLTRAQALDLKAKMNTLHNHFRTKYNPPNPNTWGMEIEFKITARGRLAIKQARPWVN